MQGISTQAYLKLLGLSAALLFILPALVQHGMFMDGVQYACVAKNLAAGKGTFWFPYLSASWSKAGSGAFLEHLPLSYFLQAGFFTLLGESIFVEKIYGLFAAILSAFLIFRIWLLLFSDRRHLQDYWWLAVVLWFVTPSVFWSFKNNMLENTVSVMALAATYFALLSLHRKRALLYVSTAAAFVIAATMCKGLPGLFPAAVYLCYYLGTGKISGRKTLAYTFILLLLPLLFYSLLISFHEPAAESIGFYVKHRLFSRVENDPTVENRFSILFWLLTDQFVNIGLLLALLGIFGFKKFAAGIEDKKLILFFLLLGFCGVAPLTLTHVQRATYFVPALSFFAIAFAVFLSPGLHALVLSAGRKARLVLKSLAIAAAVAVPLTCILLAGKNSRDGEMLSEVHAIGRQTPRGASLNVPYDIYNQWDFQFYLLRYYELSLRYRDIDSNDVFLFRKNNLPALMPGKKIAETKEHVLVGKN